jgi:hypothetical protein
MYISSLQSARMPLYPKIEFDKLCIDLINAVLGTELEPGLVILSTQAHRHIAEDHAADYALCIAALADALIAPTFIGQGPKADNFEVVRRINHPEGAAVLVAVGLTVDDDGAYRIRSSYLISERKVDERRRAGRLKAPPPR